MRSKTAFTGLCVAVALSGILAVSCGGKGHRQIVVIDEGKAELVTFGRHSVIAVQPSKTLEKRTGVNLLHLPDGRALISFDRSMTIPGLELLIADALEDRTLPKTDRAIFEAIADILKSSRRSENVVLLQRHVIVLETRRSAASPSRRNSK